MTSPRSTRRLLRPILVAIVMLVASAYPNAANAADTLYAVTGASCSPGTLYTVDTTTSALTEVADIMIGANQVSDLTGLAIDPTTDTAYGWMNDDDCNFNSGTGTLITIDKSTGVSAGAATVVGTGAGQIADITFDRFGNLYGWSGGCGQNNCNEGGSDLYTINKATGATTKVSESGTYGFSTGLASDSNGQMYMKSYQGLFRINPFTGHAFAPVALLNSSTRNLLSFGPGDTLYTGSRNCCWSFQLQTLNKSTGAVTNIGSQQFGFQISAIDWDFDSPTTPNQADISLTNTPSTTTPSVGGSVTFALHVVNNGPSTSTISVKDKLPSGFTYVSSSTATGSYDSNTGIWSVGSLASSGSADLDIVATANATGNHTDNAEVVSASTYDPNSVPGSGEGDTFAAARAVPATSAVFYAASGSGTGFCGGTPSFLYEMDTSGGISQIAPITISGQPVLHVNGLAIDPGTGTLYGYMNTQSPDCDVNAGTLITINKDTGAAAIVGSEGAAGIRSPDLTSDPFGILYAWYARFSFEDLYTLNKTTGTSLKVGECGCFTNSVGLGDDSLGRLYMKSSNQLYRVNQFTGQLFGLQSLSQSTHNMLAFGPSDALYTGNRTSTNNVTNGFQLKQINRSTGAVSLLGSNSALNIAALAWDLRTYTPPGRADLSLDKTVDNASPDDWGDQVTFTITVSNAGPADATDVKVRDQLPTNGPSYVSHTASAGTYNSSTGIWDIGTIADGDSETLDIVTTVPPTCCGTNVAEVIDSTTYDTDSVPGSATGDTYDTLTVTPTAHPDIDAAADVVVNGPTKANATSKGFTVLIQNVGIQSFTVDNSELDVEINGNGAAATCKPFSTTLKPGRSVRVHCSANIATVGVSPGQSVTYSATVDEPQDGFTTNDTDSEVRTAS